MFGAPTVADQLGAIFGYISGAGEYRVLWLLLIICNCV